MKALQILSIFLFSTVTVYGQEIKVQVPDLDQTIPTTEKVRIGQLDNGLTYFIRKNSKPEKRVEYRLVIKAGSILEDEDQLGLAHFVEHMAFNGSKNFEKNELVDYLQSAGIQFGADLNAYTSFDETVYMLPLPTDDAEIMDKGLLVLEDWAGGVSFTGEEIDKERGVVIEEWRLGRGANQRMLQQWLPVAMKDSRYADRLPIGTKESLENFSHDAVRRFYKDWYRPDLMAIVAVGDIDVDEIETEIKKRFSKLKAPRKKRERTRYDVPDHDETLVTIATDPEATMAQIQVIYKHDKEEETTLHDYRRYFIESLYNGMLGMRFQELTQQADPPFVFGSSSYGSYIGPKDAYTAFAAVSENGVDRGLKALITENERVLQHGFTQGELDRYKLSTLNRYERAYNERDKSQSGSYAAEYIRAFLEKEPIPGIEFEYEFLKRELPGITLEEVNSLASNWITEKNRVVMIIGPEKEGLTYPSEAEIKSILTEYDGKPTEPYEDSMSGSTLVSTLPPAGKVSSVEKIENVDVTEWKLSNGATIVLKKTNFKNDEIRMRAFAFGGHSIYSDEDYQSASNATGIVSMSGVSEFSAVDLRKYLSGKTVGVSPYISTYSSGLNGSAAPKDLETLFEMVHAYFTSPRKDSEAFGAFMNRNKMMLQNIMSSPQYYYQDKVSKILSQNNPRGGGIPTEKDLEEIDLDRAFEIYKDRFADASEFTFFFVGNLEEETMKPLVEKYIASLPASNRNSKWKDLGIRPPSGLVDEIVEKGTDPKSQVTLVFTGDYEPDAKSNYLMTSLGSALSIRLIEVLREEIGGVYGAGASGSFSRIPTPRFNFRIGFGCGPENLDKLVEATFEEIRKFKEEGVPEEVVQKVAEQQKRDREENLKENGYWINQLRGYYYAGRSLDDFYNYEKLVEGLNGDDLQELANKYIDLKEYIKIVLMPEGE